MKTCSICKKSKSYFDFYERIGLCVLRTDCKECFASRSKVKYVSNRQKHLDAMKRHYLANKAKYSVLSASWRSTNPEKMREYKRAWKKRNKSTVRASDAKRRAIELRAIPNWLTKNQLEEIKNIYKTCPKGYHVDHIVPLQGKDVRGLHVPWNLQHLSAFENSSKGNRF